MGETEKRFSTGGWGGWLGLGNANLYINESITTSFDGIIVSRGVKSRGRILSAHFRMNEQTSYPYTTSNTTKTTTNSHPF